MASKFAFVLKGSSGAAMGLSCGFAASAFATDELRVASAFSLPNLSSAVASVDVRGGIGALLEGSKGTYKHHEFEALSIFKLFSTRNTIFMVARNGIIPFQEYMSGVIQAREQQEQYQEMGYFDEDLVEFPEKGPFTRRAALNLGRDYCIQGVKYTLENYAARNLEPQQAWKLLKKPYVSAVRKVAEANRMIKAGTKPAFAVRKSMMHSIGLAAARGVLFYTSAALLVDQAIVTFRYLKSLFAPSIDGDFDPSEGRPIDLTWLALKTTRHALRVGAALCGTYCGAALGSVAQASLRPQGSVGIMACAIAGEITASIVANILLAVAVGGKPTTQPREGGAGAEGVPRGPGAVRGEF